MQIKPMRQFQGKKLSRMPPQWQGMGIIIGSVAVVVIALQTSGALQFLETTILDGWFRWRPSERSESRVVIVTINESDISRLGRWPLADATLAKLLKTIKNNQPQAIGLDLYRNLPVKPGTEELNQVFASTPNLIGIQKAQSNSNNPEVAPPEILQGQNQVAASDLVQDPDGKIRRHLLAVRDSHGKTTMTLGVRLALVYLEAKNIKLVASKDSVFELGKAKFQPLAENAGGYVNADVGGYQILSNFYKLPAGYSKISLTDVLENRIPANFMRGRIVLIASVASSLNDKFYTPYSTDIATTWSGAEIHADLANQILSAALDNRLLMKGVSEPLEWLWILLWASLGTALGWQVHLRNASVSTIAESKFSRWAVVLIPLASCSLIGSTYLLFLVGWWISLASPFLAFVSAGITSRIYWFWSKLKFSYQALADHAEVLELKVQERTQELAEKEHFLRSIYDGVEEAIFVVDILENGEFQYVGVNSTYEQITGFRLSELQGKSPEQVFSPGIASVIYNHYQACCEAKKTITYEEHLLYQEQEIWLLTSLTPLQQQQINRLIGCSVNITERKLAEAALQKSEARFRTAFEVAAIGKCLVSLNGKILQVNASFCQMIGYLEVELLSLTFREITVLDDREIDSNFLQQLLKGEIASYQVEKRYLHKTGKIIWTILSVSLVRDAQKPHYFIYQFQNISDRKLVETSLEAAKVAAEAANLAKSQFLANMSHELRTPLNGILGYAQILQADKTATAKQRESSNVIYQCGMHLLTLINDILDLSKIEANKLELYPEDFNFAAFLSGIINIFRIKAAEKSLVFTSSDFAQLPTLIHADEKRLRQVLLNLISNAIKFTNKGSVTFTVKVIELGLKENSKINQRLSITTRIRFQVEDTGVGITEQQLEKIFLPFEQVGEQKYRSEGTGLGLAITHKILTMMASQIVVESTPGVGSIFWFDLDLPIVSTLEITEKSTTKITGYLEKAKKILIVDDSWENRAIMLNILEPIGFELYQAVNGQDGLEQAIKFQPDLIITDLMMPVIDGLEMTRQLRQLKQNSIVIAVSANVLEVERQKSLASGCQDFLVKPFQVDELLQKIQDFLNLSWIYDDNLETLLPKSENSQPITEMIILPKEILIALYEAAMGGDVEAVEDRIFQLQKLSPDYANKLLELANDFRYEDLAHLVEFKLK